LYPESSFSFMKFRLLLLPFVVLLFSFNSITVAKDPTPKKIIPVSLNKKLMLQLVNEIREKGCQCGDTYYYPVPALEWNDQLEAAALAHSVDMYKKNYFSHTAPDGSRAGKRIEKAGYQWTAYGENIGSGYRREQEVVEGWLKSPGHCKNIMSRMYREMGVGRVGSLWTQAFAVR